MTGDVNMMQACITREGVRLPSELVNVYDRVVSLCHPAPLRAKVPCIPWRVLAWFWIRLGRIRIDERQP